MTNKEKVINGLDSCAKWMKDNDGDACDNCPYHPSHFSYDNNDCYAALYNDTIALLKEQEPREPHYTTLKYIIEGTEMIVHHPECPRCIENGLAIWDAEIKKGQAYCHRCGQEVKWND